MIIEKDFLDKIKDLFEEYDYYSSGFGSLEDYEKCVEEIVCMFKHLVKNYEEE